MSYSSGFNPTPGSNETQLILYNYRPALSFNVIATVLFFLLACVHAYWLAKYRTTNIIQALFVTMCLWEFAAYVLRCVNHDRPFRGDLFAGQYVSNIVAANGIIAAIQLGCLHGVRVNEPLSVWTRLKARTIRNVFMTLNLLTAIWQIIGTSMVSVAEIRAANGVPNRFSTYSANRVLLSSLAFQVFHLTLFQAIVTYLLIKSLSKRNTASHSALNRQTTNTTANTATTAVDGHALRPAVKTFLFLVFLTIGMLWMRTIYRLVETAQRFYGNVHSSEALYGVFEFAPVWTAAAIWAIKPFGRWLIELATDAFTHPSTKVGPNATVA